MLFLVFCVRVRSGFTAKASFDAVAMAGIKRPGRASWFYVMDLGFGDAEWFRARWIYL